MLRTPTLGGSISVAQRKLLWGGRRGSQTIYKSATKRVGNLNIKDYDLVRKTRYQVKEFSVLLCIGRCKLLSSLNTFLSYATQLFGAKSYFLIVYILNSLFILRQIWWTDASCHLLSSSAIIWWQHLLDRRSCVLFGEPSFTSGSPKLLMAVTFLAHQYGRKYFISHKHLLRKWTPISEHST